MAEKFLNLVFAKVPYSVAFVVAVLAAGVYTGWINLGFLSSSGGEAVGGGGNGLQCDSNDNGVTYSAGVINPLTDPVSSVSRAVEFYVPGSLGYDKNVTTATSGKNSVTGLTCGGTYNVVLNSATNAYVKALAENLKMSDSFYSKEFREETLGDLEITGHNDTVTGSWLTPAYAGGAYIPIEIGNGSSGTLSLKLVQNKTDAQYGVDNKIGVGINYSSTSFFDTSNTNVNVPSGGSAAKIPCPGPYTSGTSRADVCFELTLSDGSLKDTYKTAYVDVVLRSATNMDPSNVTGSIVVFDTARYLYNGVVYTGYSSPATSSTAIGAPDKIIAFKVGDKAGAG